MLTRRKYIRQAMRLSWSGSIKTTRYLWFILAIMIPIAASVFGWSPLSGLQTAIFVLAILLLLLLYYFAFEVPFQIVRSLDDKVSKLDAIKLEIDRAEMAVSILAGLHSVGTEIRDRIYIAPPCESSDQALTDGKVFVDKQIADASCWYDKVRALLTLNELAYFNDVNIPAPQGTNTLEHRALEKSRSQIRLRLQRFIEIRDNRTKEIDAMRAHRFTLIASAKTPDQSPTHTSPK